MNCIIIDDDDMSVETLRHLISQVSFLTLTKVYRSATEALGHLNEGNVNLIFLDVVMPGLSGLELLDSLSSYPQVIIVSCKKQYAVEAFEHKVTDYLLKPITYQRFLKAVHRVQEVQGRESKIVKEDIYIKHNGIIVRLKTDDILFIEGAADYVEIYTQQKKYMIHSSLRALENKLPTNFIRVHKSFIINLKHIPEIEDFVISIKDPFSKQLRHIPVGNVYKNSLMNRLKVI